MTEVLKITLTLNTQNTINLPGNEGISYVGYTGSIVFKESRLSSSVLLHLFTGSSLVFDENGATVSMDSNTVQTLKDNNVGYYRFETESANKNHCVRIEAPVEVL